MAGAAAWGRRRATAAGLQRLLGTTAESSPRLARRRPMGVATDLAEVPFPGKVAELPEVASQAQMDHRPAHVHPVDS
ncbi:hypothetical protein E2562_007053 [Oryza meyeriana var. granulata]|uniref:Uncharacterized protein n=1 Tax=Oryza meyeriana var. granulata TaxID=110450 RepID=A0A6G1F4L5_9ORYZ|nr:hypothetical protein E2562_007053 [Oryza meyeriana var. granulata]